jgi:hypothetical protein
LELCTTEGWKYTLLIAECSLALIEHLKKGGSMRLLSGRNIDQIECQFPTFENNRTQRTVAFKMDTNIETVDNGGQATQEE